MRIIWLDIKLHQRDQIPFSCRDAVACKREIPPLLCGLKNNLLMEQECLSEIKNIQLNIPQHSVFLLEFEKHADNFNPIENDLQCYWGLC